MLNVKDLLDKLVDDIFAKGKSFYNAPLSLSLKPLVHVEGDKNSGKVIVPRWFPVTQKGRGPRKTTKTTWTNFKGYEMSTFQLAIYLWLEKKNGFESTTDAGKINEAKGLAWYINKYGNKHYRSGVYIDIYDTLVKELTIEVRKQFMVEAVRITSELVKL
jgi:hypothetical protein